jgi:DNA helicase-2/ATP-dependent DNA helicase PcrA
LNSHCEVPLIRFSVGQASQENVNLLNQLNPTQREACDQLAGPVLILAGAGSGKTRTVTYRIAHMIRDQGVAPDSILAITFTNKAAREMKERTKQLIRTKKSPEICTFHSFGISVLSNEIELLGYQKNFTLYDRSDQMSLLREALKNYKGGKAFDRSTIITKISNLKNQVISAAEYPGSPYFDPFDDYCLVTEYCYQYLTERMKFFNAIDFDDILMLVVKLFREFPEVAHKYSRKYRFITVDEYQDTNPLQFEMISGLTSQHQNICVVGDDDQAIYSFRGADITNILNFERQFSKTKVIKLEENYRSTKSILNLANEVIRRNKKRKEKAMWTKGLEGELPYLWVTQDSTHEAQIVADQIDILRNDGVKLSEIAILYRSNTQTPFFEDQLRLSQIPYKMIGGQKLYEKKEVKDLIAYLQVIQNPNNEVALRRILNVPARGIGNKTLEKYLELASKNNISLYKSMKMFKEESKPIAGFLTLIEKLKSFSKDHGLYSSLDYILNQTDYISFIERIYDEGNQAEFRKNSLELLKNSAQRFEEKYKEDDTLKKFIDLILLADNQDSQNEEGESKNEVTLMTLHSSKGLEFDYVFMVGVEEELLPHKKTIVQDEDISEERRLCYVGITRARKMLYMTRCKERNIYNKKVPRKISRFLLKLKDFYHEQDRTGFGHMTEQEAQAHKSQVFSNILSMLD